MSFISKVNILLKEKNFKFKSKLTDLNSIEFNLDLYNKEKGLESKAYRDNREMIYMSPSTLCNKCPRFLQYSLLNAQGKEFRLGRVIRITDNGKLTHEQYTEYFKNMNALWGGWECEECKNEWIGDVGMCPKCSSFPESHKYKEVTLYDDKLQIKGKPDGVLIFSNGIRAVVDYKTIKEEEYFKVKDEFSIMKYYEQINYYGYLLDIPYCILLYINRNGHHINPIVFKTEPQVYLDKVIILNEVRKYIRNRMLIEKPSEAYNKSCEFCKFCDYADLCWGVRGKCEALSFIQCDNRNAKMIENNL